MTDVIPPTIDIHLSPRDLRDAMEQDVRTGLTAAPKMLPPVYFYDERGSKLFDAITRLPEYYPTRSERSILDAHAKDIAEPYLDAYCGINNMPRAKILDWLPYVAAARLAEDVPDDFERLLEIVHS